MRSGCGIDHLGIRRKEATSFTTELRINSIDIALLLYTVHVSWRGTRVTLNPKIYWRAVRGDGGVTLFWTLVFQ